MTRKKIKNMSYEEAYNALKNHIRQLETDNKSLEAALSLYEEGQQLAAHCQRLLDEATLRVQTLDESTNAPSPSASPNTELVLDELDDDDELENIFRPSGNEGDLPF